MLVVASGCADGPSVPASASVAGSGPASAATATPAASASADGGSAGSGPGAIESTASCVSRTLASMSRAQRIGQLFMVRVPVAGLSAADRSAIADEHLGNAWYSRSTSGVTAMRAVSDSIQATATAAATARVPFLIGANQEGGLIQGLSGPGFSTIPSAVAQGKLDPSRLESLAATWARQLRQAGVNVNFAPVADVVPPGTADQNAPIGQLDREYGHHPKPVARHVAAFVEGMRAGGVGATAKHFPGLGRVEGNTDHTANVVDTVTTADDPYLRPFRRAIAEGVPFVMVSLATYERIDPVVDRRVLARRDPRPAAAGPRLHGRRDVRQPHGGGGQVRPAPRARAAVPGRRRRPDRARPPATGGLDGDGARRGRGHRSAGRVEDR